MKKTIAYRNEVKMKGEYGSPGLTTTNSGTRLGVVSLQLGVLLLFLIDSSAASLEVCRPPCR